MHALSALSKTGSAGSRSTQPDASDQWGHVGVVFKVRIFLTWYNFGFRPDPSGHVRLSLNDVSHIGEGMLAGIHF